MAGENNNIGFGFGAPKKKTFEDYANMEHKPYEYKVPEFKSYDANKTTGDAYIKNNPVGNFNTQEFGLNKTKPDGMFNTSYKGYNHQETVAEAAKNIGQPGTGTGTETSVAPTKKGLMTADGAEAAGAAVGMGVTAAGEAISDFDPNDTKYSKGKVAADTAIGVAAPVLTAVAAGALAGSAVPVVGTVIGAVVGGITGFLKGKKKRKIAGENADQRDRKAAKTAHVAGKKQVQDRAQAATSTAQLLYGNTPGAKPNAPVGTVQGFGNNRLR